MQEFISVRDAILGEIVFTDQLCTPKVGETYVHSFRTHLFNPFLHDFFTLFFFSSVYA
jgi:hypothetical protein